MCFHRITILVYRFKYTQAFFKKIKYLDKSTDRVLKYEENRRFWKKLINKMHSILHQNIGSKRYSNETQD